MSNMTVTYYNPFRELEEMSRGFFSDFFGEPRTASIRTDITDEGDHYQVQADLPGFAKEDIQIDIEDDVLTLHAERKSENENGEGKYLRRERSYGSYTRRFDLSEINADEINASYRDGVLTLNLPKRQVIANTARRIEIQ